MRLTTALLILLTAASASIAARTIVVSFEGNNEIAFISGDPVDLTEFLESHLTNFWLDWRTEKSMDFVRARYATDVAYIKKWRRLRISIKSTDDFKAFEDAMNEWNERAGRRIVIVNPAPVLHQKPVK